MPYLPPLPPRNIIILGAPRSGTTLLNALICEGKDSYPMLPECTYITQLIQHFYNILHYSDAPRFEAYARDEGSLRALYQESVHHFLEIAKSHFPKNIYTQLVLKDPMLTLIADMIPVFLAPCVVIGIVRDPRAVIASMLRVEQKKKKDVTKLAVPSSEKLSCLLPLLQKLKTAASKLKLARIEQKLSAFIASRCVEQNDIITDIFNFYSRLHGCELYQNKKIHIVKYEDLIVRQEKTFQDLEAFLGFQIGRKGFEKTFFSFDTKDPTHSENYGKDIQKKEDDFKKTLSPEQLIKIQEIFSGLNQIYKWW